MTIFLRGSLGAGKTTLTRGILRGLGYKDKVKSPTYTIVEPYHVAGKVIYHFDLYRLNQPEELDHMGVIDYFTPATICIVEWPENGEGHLPQADIECIIDFNHQGRQVKLIANTLLGEKILKAL